MVQELVSEAVVIERKLVVYEVYTVDTGRSSDQKWRKLG